MWSQLMSWDGQLGHWGNNLSLSKGHHLNSRFILGSSITDSHFHQHQCYKKIITLIKNVSCPYILISSWPSQSEICIFFPSFKHFWNWLVWNLIHVICLLLFFLRSWKYVEQFIRLTNTNYWALLFSQISWIKIQQPICHLLFSPMIVL